MSRRAQEERAWYTAEAEAAGLLSVLGPGQVPTSPKQMPPPLPAMPASLAEVAAPVTATVGAPLSPVHDCESAADKSFGSMALGGSVDRSAEGGFLTESLRDESNVRDESVLGHDELEEAQATATKHSVTTTQS